MTTLRGIAQPSHYSLTHTLLAYWRGLLSIGWPIFVAEGEKVRVTVLEEVKGETVMIGFSSPATEFDEFAPHAQKVVDSVKWGGS